VAVNTGLRNCAAYDTRPFMIFLTPIKDSNVLLSRFVQTFKNKFNIEKKLFTVYLICVFQGRQHKKLK